MNELQENLHSLLDYVAQSAPSHRFLPYIVEDINAMMDELDKSDTNSDKLKKLALGLGIFISDDFDFSESETGTKILDVVNSIVRSK
jgi:hypothetical protein